MRHGSDPWVGKIHWKRPQQPTLVVLPGESHGQRNLEGYRPQGRKESDTTEVIQYTLSGLDGKEYTCSAGDLDSNPGLGRSPGGEHGNLLQYSCLENPMDRGTWWATVHGLRELDVTERLNTAEYIWIDKMGILSEYM